MRSNFLSSGLLTLTVVSLIACGGGGPSAPPGFVSNAKFAIAWPSRSKSIDAPSSALSFRFVMNHAGQGGADVTLNGNRPGGTGAANTTYTLPQFIASSGGSFTITFYAGAGQTGSVVGQATDTADLTGNQLNIANVELEGTVNSVTVPNTTLILGSGSTQLTFTAKDADSNTLAVSPGSATWRMVDGSNVTGLTVDGMASPIAVGTAHVIAKVDGVDSNSASVVVQTEQSGDITFELIKPETTIEEGTQVFGNTLILDLLGQAYILDYPSQVLTTYPGGKAAPNLQTFLADFRNQPEDQMHAAVRTGGPNGSVVDLHPPGLTSSKTYDLDNSVQVGSVFNTVVQYTHAAIWNSTAVSFKDINPAGATSSVAQSTFNGISGGYASYPATPGKAIVWSGETATIIHPAGWQSSAVSAVGAQYVAGGVGDSLGDNYMGVWTTAGAGFKVLDPTDRTVIVRAVGRDGFSAEFAVGSREYSNDSKPYAVLWNVKTGKSINLDNFIPSGSHKSSHAFGLGVAPDGLSIRVVGKIHNNLRDYAAMWTIPDEVLETIRN